MSSLNDSDFHFLPGVGDGPRLSAPPKALVRLAGIAILLLAGVGLVRGVLGERPASPSASPLAVLTGLSPAATAAAKPAVLMPPNAAWSTLSGPKMVNAKDQPVVKARPAASDDDESDDSDSPAATTAAADAITPDAPDAPPAAPAASSNAAAPTSPPQ